MKFANKSLIIFQGLNTLEKENVSCEFFRQLSLICKLRAIIT